MKEIMSCQETMNIIFPSVYRICLFSLYSMKDNLSTCLILFRRVAQCYLSYILKLTVVIFIMTMNACAPKQNTISYPIDMNEVKSEPEFVYVPVQNYQQNILVSTTKYDVQVG